MPTVLPFHVAPIEHAVLWAVSHARMQAKRPGTSRKWSRGKTDVQVTYEGLVGEWKTSYYLGVPLDLRAYVHGDGGEHDLVMLDGRRVNVKTRDWDGEGLEVLVSPDEMRAEILVGVRFGLAKGPRGEILGWLPREDVVTREVVDRGYGPRLRVPAEELRDMTELAG